MLTGRWLHLSSHRSVFKDICGDMTTLPGGFRGLIAHKSPTQGWAPKLFVIHARLPGSAGPIVCKEMILTQGVVGRKGDERGCVRHGMGGPQAIFKPFRGLRTSRITRERSGKAKNMLESPRQGNGERERASGLQISSSRLPPMPGSPGSIKEPPRGR